MAKVLIIDDDAPSRELLTLALEEEGYQVRSAANGVNGLAMARADVPDLIVLDMGLPMMNGWQVTEHIRGDWRLRATPILAISGFTMKFDRARALRLGCNAYLAKPLDLDQLCATMRSLLGSRAPSTAGAAK